MLRDKDRPIAEVALQAAAPFGFVLGGEAALAAHGLTNVSPSRVDLVTGWGIGRYAADRVEGALRRAGYQAERLDERSEVQGAWPGGGERLPQWRVTAGPHARHARGYENYEPFGCQACRARTYLSLAREPRSRDPVSTQAGPVLHPEDAAGAAMRNLLRRGQLRDFAHVADLLERWSLDELTGLARRLDPGLTDRDVARAARRLDRCPDHVLTLPGYGLPLPPKEASRVRERFAGWPRDTREADRQQREPAIPGRDIGDRAAARHGHDEPGHTRAQLRELETGGLDGRPGTERSQDRGRAARASGRQRPAERQRARDDDREIGR